MCRPSWRMIRRSSSVSTGCRARAARRAYPACVVHSFTAPHVMCTAVYGAPTTAEPRPCTRGATRSRQPRPPPQRRDAARAGRLAVGPEHRCDGLAVPELLEGPDRQERREVRVAVGGRDEQIAQVADGVVLDVVHVAQTPQGGVVERVGGRHRSRSPRGRPGPHGACRSRGPTACPPFVAEAAADGRRHVPNGRRAR